MFIITSVWWTDIYLLLVAISREGVTSTCVLESTDVNKQGQRRRHDHSIKRRSSVSEKQILLRTKTHSYESKLLTKKNEQISSNKQGKGTHLTHWMSLDPTT